jgi:hypothetical protein
MKRLTIGCVLLLLTCLMGTVLEATPITYQASLDGAQTVPPTGSLATGLGTITVDSATHLLTFDLSWSNLVANPIGLHLHCCAPVGANGMLAINFSGFPAATSGVYRPDGRRAVQPRVSDGARWDRGAGRSRSTGGPRSWE